MAKTKNKGEGGKRFGPRYGAPIRQKISKVEKKQKALYKCPLCNQRKVKRVSIGIWSCKKCDTKFAGGAYSFKE